MQKNISNSEDLPFIKRVAFKDEKEFRLFYTSQKAIEGFYSFKVPVSAISKVVLNPWLPRIVGKNVAATLRSIDGCVDLKVSISTLIDNEKWKDSIEITF